ncbi:MAG: DUF1415 domain-containing protein [Enterobacterales bacterium]|nr:DUF1415 domain-containing protein [Enterobacterales bacterium]
MPPSSCNLEPFIQATRFWLEKSVIGFNFCPFAKPVFRADAIHYSVITTENTADQLEAVANELQRLEKQPEIETSLLIFSKGLKDFHQYLDWLELANQLSSDMGFEGHFQLASFHPDYCFEGAQTHDASNYTNRSPYPMLHIIREASVEKALAHYPNPERIPETNIKVATEQGEEVFKTILKQSKASFSGSD